MQPRQGTHRSLSPRTHTFHTIYDSVYRLTEAKEITGTIQNWIQQFGYDRYGNRTSYSQTIGAQTQNQTPAVDASTNRFTANQGFEYDKNGNIVEDIDAASSLAREFIFNGDNKQVEVKKNGITIGRYFYDGEGRRVKKVTDAETTIFVYSAGKLIAEYSTQISQTPSTSYLTNDHLGSPRIITDELGQAKSRRDFMPFGEELFINVGARTESLKYGTNEDEVRQKFTGYQKDNETDLDFAEARMYQNLHGRFTAIDPLLASGKSNDPQPFNRYIYVMNDPIKFVDPNGLCSAPSGLKKGQVGICIEAFIASKRIKPGSPGHGDGRTFSGDNPELTNRIQVQIILEANKDGVSAHSVTRPGVSFVSVAEGLKREGTMGEPDSGVTDISAGFQGRADAKLSGGFTRPVGSEDFGITNLNVTGTATNGVSALADDLQNSMSPLTQAAGHILDTVGPPPGTIDFSMNFKITGSGTVELTGGETRSYPSYAAYSYAVGANEKIQTTELKRIPEGTIDELTKPMKKIP